MIAVGFGLRDLAAQSPTDNGFPAAPTTNPLPRAFIATWADPMFGGEGPVEIVVHSSMSMATHEEPVSFL